jgi:hypothetical protein
MTLSESYLAIFPYSIITYAIPNYSLYYHLLSLFNPPSQLPTNLPANRKLYCIFMTRMQSMREKRREEKGESDRRLLATMALALATLTVPALVGNGAATTVLTALA